MTHVAQLKVRFYELDPYDHVNHANYFNYFEAARIEALESVGFGLGRMKRDGFQIVVTELTARFMRPAELGDVLTIETEVVETKRVTARWRQRMSRNEEPVAVLEVKAAITDLVGKPRRAPAEFIEALAPFRVS